MHGSLKFSFASYCMVKTKEHVHSNKEACQNYRKQQVKWHAKQAWHDFKRVKWHTVSKRTVHYAVWDSTYQPFHEMSTFTNFLCIIKAVNHWNLFCMHAVMFCSLALLTIFSYIYFTTNISFSWAKQFSSFPELYLCEYPNNFDKIDIARQLVGTWA